MPYDWGIHTNGWKWHMWAARLVLFWSDMGRTRKYMQVMKMKKEECHPRIDLLRKPSAMHLAGLLRHSAPEQLGLNISLACHPLMGHASWRPWLSWFEPFLFPLDWKCCSKLHLIFSAAGKLLKDVYSKYTWNAKFRFTPQRNNSGFFAGYISIYWVYKHTYIYIYIRI